MYEYIVFVGCGTMKIPFKYLVVPFMYTLLNMFSQLNLQMEKELEENQEGIQISTSTLFLA